MGLIANRKAIELFFKLKEIIKEIKEEKKQQEADKNNNLPNEGHEKA